MVRWQVSLQRRATTSYEPQDSGVAEQRFVPCCSTRFCWTLAKAFVPAHLSVPNIDGRSLFKKEPQLGLNPGTHSFLSTLYAAILHKPSRAWGGLTEGRRLDGRSLFKKGPQLGLNPGTHSFLSALYATIFRKPSEA